jgi:hypothetical protein
MSAMLFDCSAQDCRRRSYVPNFKWFMIGVSREVLNEVLIPSSSNAQLEDYNLLQSVIEASAAWATVNKPSPKGSNQYTYLKNAFKMWNPEKVGCRLQLLCHILL